MLVPAAGAEVVLSEGWRAGAGNGARAGAGGCRFLDADAACGL